MDKCMCLRLHHLVKGKMKDKAKTFDCIDRIILCYNVSYLSNSENISRSPRISV